MAENGVIGREGAMPWTLSSDLKRFKAQTMGRPVIMGRKTHESIGRALPGRLNLVVTRDRHWRAPGVETAASLDEAIALATVRLRCMNGEREICVIGGGEIYAQAIGRADRLHVTHVLASIEGDTFFPPIDAGTWEAASSDSTPAAPGDSHATRHIVYRRRAAAAGTGMPAISP